MDIESIHPELQRTFARLPHLPFHNRLVLRLVRYALKYRRQLGSIPGVDILDIVYKGIDLRLYQPTEHHRGAALLWIHGGGLILGNNWMNDRECLDYARKLGITVISVEYRLAPEHPFPAALDDCYIAWEYIQDYADKLGVDPERIAISGQSAGGGLAASLSQRIYDCGHVQPAVQALFSPMLDSNTATRSELDGIKHKMWNNRSNRAAWSAYLGHSLDGREYRDYAVPANRTCLKGLPPAWIGIGSVDLFYEESLNYCSKLEEAGTNCMLHVAPGAFHGSDGLDPEATPSRAMRESNYQFLKEKLSLL